VVHEGKNWYLCRERRTKKASVKEPTGNSGPEKKRKNLILREVASGFSGLEVACWPLETKFAELHPAEAVGFFRAKNYSTPSFGGEIKPSVLCRSFTACKRSLNVTRKTAFRQNYRTFCAHSSTFRRWVLSRGDTRGGA
jgi:hypothetical protein